MPKGLHISEIYASELEALHYGYPLWNPEGPKGADEIQIGDVGYISQGRFIEVFKAQHSADHELNRQNKERGRIPPGHEPIPENDLTYPIVDEHYMVEGLYATSSRKDMKVKPTVGGGLAGLAEGTVKYSLSVSGKKTAFLAIPYDATSTVAERTRRIEAYVRQYRYAWKKHIKDMGIPHELLMVYGVVKTVEWIVGASHTKTVEHRGALELQAGVPLVSGNLCLEVSREVSKDRSIIYLKGPHKRLHSAPQASVTASPSSSSVATTPTAVTQHSPMTFPTHGTQHSLTVATDPPQDPPQADQAIFLRYYIVKWRLEARAGPHQLPRNSAQGDSAAIARNGDSDWSRGEESEVLSPQDHSGSTWLDILLDFLLQETCADVAITCHEDLYSLISRDEAIDDFHNFLRHARPKILVNGDNVASLDPVSLVMNYHKRSMSGPLSHTDTGDYPHRTDTGENDGRNTRNENTAVQIGRRTIVGGTVLLDNRATHLDWPHFLLSGKNDEVEYVSSMTLSSSSQEQVVVAGCAGGVTQLWSSATGQLMQNFHSPYNEAISAVALSPDGGLLASGTTEGDILVVAAKAEPPMLSQVGGNLLGTVQCGDVLLRLDGHLSGVSTIAFSPDARWIASGSTDCTVMIWAVSLPEYTAHLPITTAAVHTLDSLTTEISRILFTLDSKSILFGADTDVQVYNIESGQLTATMSGHIGPIWSFALSHAGERLVTGGEDNSSRVWDCKTGEALVVIAEHRGPVWSVAWSPDDNYILSGSYNSTALLCNSFTGALVREFGDLTSSSTPVVWLKPYNIVCTGTAEGPVNLWDATSGKCLATYEGHTDKIKELIPTSNGHNIVSYSDDGTVRIWNVSDLMRLL